VQNPTDFALEVHQRLLDHYDQPVWQSVNKPMDQLISTILSQNTNDGNRDRAYRSLREALPTWEAVRDADPQEVIESINIAGLANQKGPRIQRVLQRITEERGALDLEFLRELPPEEVRSWLLSFHGVGPKTAAILLLFSLDMQAFPVDTHIYRVTGRLGLRDEKINAEKAHEVLEELFPPETYYAVHLNLIRHGREICLARTPACERCVLSDICSYYQNLNSENTISLAAEPTTDSGA
jgi:endonuclease-3